MATKRKKKPVVRSDSGAKRFPMRRPVNLKIPMRPADPFGFGDDADPEDSERLRRLRSIIDEELGWVTLADEEAGDYEARLHQVATQLGNVGFVRFSFGKVIR